MNRPHLGRASAAALLGIVLGARSPSWAAEKLDEGNRQQIQRLQLRRDPWQPSSFTPLDFEQRRGLLPDRLLQERLRQQQAMDPLGIGSIADANELANEIEAAAVRSCSEAARTFATNYKLLLEHYGHPQENPPPAERVLVDAAAHFDKACLASAPTMVLPPASPSGLAAAWPYLGILALRDDASGALSPQCVGLRIAPAIVLSARHCFRSPYEGSALAQANEPGTSVVLLPFVAGAPLRRVASVKPTNIVGGFDFFHDVVTYQLADADDSDAYVVPEADAAKPGEKLVVAGFFPSYKKGLDPHKRDTWLSADEVRSALRWSRDLPQICVLKESSRGCVYHTCQTVGGFSGAVVLRRSASLADARLPIVAMHLGVADVGRGCIKHVELNVGVDAESALSDASFP